MNKREWKYVIRVLKDFAEKNRALLVCIGFLIVVASVRPYINIILMGLLLDKVYEGSGLDVLLKMAFMVLGSNMLLRMTEARVREWFNRKNEYIREIEGRAINKKSLAIDYEYLEDSHVQELRYKSQAKGDFMGTVGWLLYLVEQLGTAVLRILLAIVILVPLFINTNQVEGGIFSWISSLVLLGLIILSVYANYKYNNKCIKKIKAEKDRQIKYNTRVDYYLDKLAGTESQKDLRVYAQQDIIEKDVAETFGEIVQSRKRNAKNHIKLGLFSQGISDATGLLVYLFTGLRAYMGVITIGNVVTYASSILQFSNAIALFASNMADFKFVSMYCKDYAEYMDLSKRKYEGTIPLEKRRDNKFSVEFEHVSFRYPGTDRDIIHDLNLKFTIGSKMAIVGKNGSGKTTFIKLLCRLYDVTEGCIKVNGIDIRKYDYREYCNLFAVVFQDFRIFSFQLGENVAAIDLVDEERAKDALFRAGLGERMNRLQDGLSTYVGKDYVEDGINFSGGEKQKMAIARAIYKDAPFVIMDEPTAALDPVSECEVFAGFDRMVGNKTAIYISHRLASCRFCEDILVFDRGKVIQRGKHEELEQQDGLYRELWNAQAQYYA